MPHPQLPSRSRRRAAGVIKLWEGLGSNLATRLWTIQDAALAFWAWTAAVWVIDHGGWPYLTQTMKPLFTEASAAQLLAIGLAAVLAVAISTILIARLTLPTLRALEGYGPLAGLRANRIATWKTKLATLQQRQVDATDDPAQTELQLALRRFPPEPDVMPTRIGNILRAGERRPAYAYGLDPVVVWPQLWLTLPDQPRTDLTGARTELDRTVAAFIWAASSTLLGLLWWPAAITGPLVAWVIWRLWIPAAAETYAHTLSALFDTHRFYLYDALHYPRPTSPSHEHTEGEKITRILWTGGIPGDLPATFTTNKDAPTTPTTPPVPT